MQLIKFATQHEDAPQQQQQLMRLLLEIQSEAKLQRLLRSLGAQQEARLLRHALAGSLSAMLVVFRQKCIQHAPHINYMQMPPLARVACASLLAKVANVKERPVTAHLDAEHLDVVRAMTTLLWSIRRLEQTALIYIDARHIEKFVGEHLLRPEHIPSLLSYTRWLAMAARQQLQNHDDCAAWLSELLRCLDALLQQQRVWWALNTSTVQDDASLRVELLEVLALVARRKLQHTIFYQRHRWHNTQSRTLEHTGEGQALAMATIEAAPQAIFIAKLIETQMDMESLDAVRCDEFVPLSVAGNDDDELRAQLQVPLVNDIPFHSSCGQGSFLASWLYLFILFFNSLCSRLSHRLAPRCCAHTSSMPTR